MKTTTVLVIILVVSVAINSYQYSRYNISNTDPLPSNCPNTVGFGEPIVINDEEAAAFQKEYVDNLVRTDSTTGGIISKKAFSKMFCQQNCNAIAYSFAKDSAGQTGPPGNGVFVIFEGVFVEYDPATDSIRAVNAIPGAAKYLGGKWCPPTCMKW